MLNALLVNYTLSHILTWLENKWEWSTEELDVIPLKTFPDANIIVDILSKFNQDTG